jgi:acetylornithine deacetylase/succinyl-diaminopimelate desuccinylase-like protein
MMVIVRDSSRPFLPWGVVRAPQPDIELLIAHIDVVEAKREDWSFEPFKLTEEDGSFYGRATSDDKYMAASTWRRAS